MPRKSSKSKSNTNKSPVKKSKLSWLFSRNSLIIVIILSILFSAYVIYLDTQIRSRFEGRIWSLPSQVYARPLELYSGYGISVQQLEHELELIGYQKVEQLPTSPGQYRQWNNRYFEIITREFRFWDGVQKSQSLKLEILNNKIFTLASLYNQSEIPLVRFEPVRIGGIYPNQGEDRELIRLKDVPDYLVLALLSVEDRRFYQHWGIDPVSIARALVANVTAGGTVQGGSTITQQLVKNLFLTTERTLWRKANEAIMALLLEMHYDKSLILETYINEVYLGQDGARAVHGFALASQYYFAKPLTRLTKDELALLVGIVKGPSWYDPRRNPERAKERRNQVLMLMAEQDVISDAQLQAFKNRPLKIAQKSYHSGNRYPAFIDLVKRQLRSDYNEDDLKSEGLRIYTTIDPLVQDAAESSVKLLARLEQQYSQTESLQTAIIVASPENGEIQALLGDRTPDYPGFNRALDASRQIGSLIKPAIYLAALQQPKRYHLASIIDDSKLRLQERSGDIWEPQNYDKEFVGDITLYHALINSRNIPAVRVGLDVGLARIVETLHNLGVERDVPPYPSITLGAFSLTPYQVATMYQSLAGKGFRTPLRAIREVTDAGGNVLNRYPLKLKQTVSAQSAYLVNFALHAVTQEGTARSLKQQLQTKVAGKTGTTDDLRDSWFAGFSDDRLAVVWVGRDDNQSTGLTGSSGALRLWTDLMKHIPARDLQLDAPENIQMQWIDPVSGGISEKACAGAIELPFISGSGPSERAECNSTSIFQRIRNFFKD